MHKTFLLKTSAPPPTDHPHPPNFCQACLKLQPSAPADTSSRPLSISIIYNAVFVCTRTLSMYARTYIYILVLLYTQDVYLWSRYSFISACRILYASIISISKDKANLKEKKNIFGKECEELI